MKITRTGRCFFMWDWRQGTSVTMLRGALFLVLSVLSLVDFLLDSILEGFCFPLLRKVQSDLTVICSKGMKVWQLR